MTDKEKEKKGGWTQWIIFIIVGVLVLALAVGIFMLWRKISTHEKDITELRAKIVVQEKEVLDIRKKADKVGKRMKEMPITSFANKPTCTGNSCEMGVEDIR